MSDVDSCSNSDGNRNCVPDSGMDYMTMIAVGVTLVAITSAIVLTVIPVIWNVLVEK